MHGQGWLSLFRVRRVGPRPDGTYVAAFVSYEPGSPLTHSELLIARVLDRRQVEITDIWVDSVVSRDDGRALWASRRSCTTSPSSTGADFRMLFGA